MEVEAGDATNRHEDKDAKEADDGDCQYPSGTTLRRRRGRRHVLHVEAATVLLLADVVRTAATFELLGRKLVRVNVLVTIGLRVACRASRAFRRNGLQ